MHLRKSAYVHPERLYILFLQLAGELATFATEERRARNYPVYDHDKLHDIFKPVLADIQAFLSAGYDRRAIRLPLEQLAPNAFKSTIVDRNLFSQAGFVIEVAARRPLTEIQNEFPRLFKVGPFGQMRQIVYSNLPGIPLIHMPVPPAQIRLSRTGSTSGWTRRPRFGANLARTRRSGCNSPATGRICSLSSMPSGRAADVGQ